MNKDKLIKQAMSELGKRSAKKNKRDYSAMGKKGMAKRWKKNDRIIEARLNVEDLLAPGDRFAEGSELTMPDGSIYVFKKGKLKKAT